MRQLDGTWVGKGPSQGEGACLSLSHLLSMWNEKHEQAMAGELSVTLCLPVSCPLT